MAEIYQELGRPNKKEFIQALKDGGWGKKYVKKAKGLSWLSQSTEELRQSKRSNQDPSVHSRKLVRKPHAIQPLSSRE